MKTMVRLYLTGCALGSLVAAFLVAPAFAGPQDIPASSGSTSTAIGTGMVTPNQKWCPPDDPEPCDPFPTNRPPTVSWAAVPISGSWFLPTDTFTVSAYASDSDGSVARVDFYVDHHVVVSDTAASYQATIGRLAAGTHTLSLVAWDNSGASDQAGDVTINVRNSVIKGNIDGVSSTGLISGWACSTYLPQSINVDLYLGGPAGTGTAAGRYLANKSSEAAVDTACSVSGGSYRFQIQLTNAQRVAYGGRTIYVHGISPVGVANSTIGASGNFRVPLAVRDAQFSAQTLITAMLPGQTANVVVKMRNNGNYIWTAASNFRLGSQNPASNTTWGVSRVNATSDVAPGQTGTFNATIRAPSTPGVYNLQWQMLQEGVAWFGDLTPNLAVKVLSGSISASPATCTIPTGTSTCTATLSWSSNSSTSEVWVSGLDGNSPQLFARNQNGTQAATWITTQGSRFTLKSDGHVLDSVDVRGIPAPVVTVTGSIDYDELGRVIARRDSTGHVKVSYQYDGNGNVTLVTDALGHATTMTYDALDRLSTSTDATGHVTKYAYDVANRVVRITDPRNNATTYTYDGFGQLWQQVSPDTGTTSFAYDPYGLLLSMTRADGTQTSYDYDALYRLTSTTAGGQTQQATYDTCPHGTGRLCSVSDSTGTTSYSYTAEGQIAGRGFAIGETTYALGYGYDVAGRLASVVYPDGNAVNYNYTHGVVSSAYATVAGVTSSVATGVTYRAGDRALASWTSSNGLVNNRGYDGDGRLTGISVPGVQNLKFTYDDADRVTKITNGMNSALTQDFGYDAVSRLTSVNSPADVESFNHDANGNRITQVVNGVSTNSTIAPSSNRLVNYGGQTIGYDANGNTVSVDGAAQFHYDAFNRLDGAGGMSYYVNAEGQRLRKAGALGTFFFAPDRSGAMLAEHAQGTWVDYVWLNGRLIGRIADGQLYAIHTDQVGRPEAVTDAARAIVWQAKNFAFGRNIASSGITLNLGFPGQYHDIETGLWNNGFRDYDDKTGRYIESDPIGLFGGMNTYSYTAGNPVMAIDPLGFMDIYAIPRYGHAAEVNGGHWAFQIYFYSNGVLQVGRKLGYALPKAGIYGKVAKAIFTGPQRIAGKPYGTSEFDREDQKMCDATDADAKALYSKMFGDTLQLNEQQLRQFLGAFNEMHPEMRGLYDPDTVIEQTVEGSNFK